MTPPDTQGEGLISAHPNNWMGIRLEDGEHIVQVAFPTTAKAQAFYRALLEPPVPVGGIEPGDVEWLEGLVGAFRSHSGTTPGGIVWSISGEDARIDRIISVLRGELGRLGPAAPHAAAEASGEPAFVLTEERTTDPDERCADCRCWKLTRSYCS